MPPAADPGAAAPLVEVVELLREIRDGLAVPPIPPQAFGATDAAAYLGQSRSSFFRGVSGGTIPGPVPTPSGPRWRRGDLDKWLASLKARRS